MTPEHFQKKEDQLGPQIQHVQDATKTAILELSIFGLNPITVEDGFITLLSVHTRSPIGILNAYTKGKNDQTAEINLILLLIERMRADLIKYADKHNHAITEETGMFEYLPD